MRKVFDKTLFSVSDENGKINLFAISLPLFLQLITMNLLNTINTAILSNYDTELVTAINASAPIALFVQSVALVASAGLNIVLSHALGKNDRQAIENVGFTAALFSFLFALALSGVCIALRTPLMKLMSLEGRTLEMAKDYFVSQLVTTVIFSSVTLCISGILRCYGKVTFVVLITVGMSALSAVNMLLFVHTSLGSHFSMITNCIINNVLVMGLQLVLMIIVLKCKKLPFGRKPNKELLKRMLRVGFPASISTISYNLSTFITTAIVSMLSPVYINVKLYCSLIFNFVWYFGNSIGQSGGVLVGRIVGAENYDKAKRMHTLYLICVVTLDALLATAAFLLRKPLFGLFDKTDEHMAIITPIFALDILVEIGRAFNHINQYSLNGAGDVRYTTIVSVISCWACAVAASYLFAIVLDWGLIGIWLAFILDEWTRAVLYSVRWASGKWRRQKV